MAVGATRRCPGSPEVGARSGGAGNCAAVARLRCIFFFWVGFARHLAGGPEAPDPLPLQIYEWIRRFNIFFKKKLLDFKFQSAQEQISELFSLEFVLVEFAVASSMPLTTHS